MVYLSSVNYPGTITKMPLGHSTAETLGMQHSTTIFNL